MLNSKFVPLDLARKRKRVDDETKERKIALHLHLTPQFGLIAALGHDLTWGEVCDAGGD